MEMLETISVQDVLPYGVDIVVALLRAKKLIKTQLACCLIVFVVSRLWGLRRTILCNSGSPDRSYTGFSVSSNPATIQPPNSLKISDREDPGFVPQLEKYED